MATYELKCWPDSFKAIVEGEKRGDYRRDEPYFFEVGDVLTLREFDPDKGDYTGRRCWREVTHIDRWPFYDIPSGFCILSLR